MPGANRAARRRKHALRRVADIETVHQQVAAMRYQYELVIQTLVEQRDKAFDEVVRLRAELEKTKAPEGASIVTDVPLIIGVQGEALVPGSSSRTSESPLLLPEGSASDQ